MKSEILRQTILSLAVLTLGVLSGYSVIGYSFREEAPNPKQKNIERRSAPFQTHYRSSQDLNDMSKSLSDKELKELISRLRKNSKGIQAENELEKLLQHTYVRGDKNLFLAMQNLFSYWGKHDPQKAFEAVMKLEGSWIMLKRSLIPTVLAFQMKNDPLQVAEWFSNSDTGLYVYTDILPDLSIALAKKSPEEAWKWLSSLRYGEQSKAMGGFFEEIYKSHPERIGEFVRQLESPEKWSFSANWEVRQKIDKVVGLWAKVDYDEAEKWVFSFPDSWTTTGFSSLLKVRAESDPAAATEMLSVIPEPARSSSLDGIAQTVISTEDNEVLYSWLETLSKIDPEVKTDDYGFIAKMNPQVSVPMLEKLPEGRVKDSLLYMLIMYDAHPDAEVALKLAEEIRSPDLREKAIKKQRDLN